MPLQLGCVIAFTGTTKHGAEVNGRNTTGSTPLHEAALAGQKGVVELLLSKGARVNEADLESGSTALHFAAGWGRAEVVKLLLERSADRTRKNKAGKTPLDLAREGGFADVRAVLEQ